MRARVSIRLSLTLLAAIAAHPARAQGWIIPRPCQPQLARCASTPPAVVRVSSDVRAQLVDRVLHYEVEETFTNRGGALGEADYLFPLPKGAAFQDLQLSVNGEMVGGETIPADEARRIYEEIVRRQRDPALVEWMGRGLLRTRIFPIAPGERKKVVVRFQAVAEREGDALRVDYFRGRAQTPADPRLAGRVADDDASVSGERAPAARTSFTLRYPESDELGTAYSPTHSLHITDAGEMRRVEVRGDAREMTLLIPVRGRSEPAISMLAHAATRDDGFALLTLTPPALPPRATPRDVTFVLDVSGSMSARKMEQARAAGKLLLATLGAADRFRLIDFSSDVRTFRDDFVPAAPREIAAATRYLDALRAEGSTNISGALEEALSPERTPAVDARGRLSVVLFVTDGEPTIGERNPQAILDLARRLRGGHRIFTFGLGADVNVSLLEQLALEGGGVAHFVRPDESPERAVQVAASRLTSPIATNVRVRAEGGVRLSKIHPAGAIDVFAGQDIVVLARYDGNGAGRVRFDGETAAGPVRWTADVTFPERERGNAFVPRLWATQRVGWLSAEKRRGGASAEVDEEIRELGERYGIPTEFTSYFVREPGVTVAGAPPVVGGVGGGVVRDGARRDEAAKSAQGRATVAEQRQQAFDAARGAAAQRAATTLAVVDSAIGEVVEGSAGGTRRAGAHVFLLRDGAWVDAAYREALKTVKVKAYSEAYFALLEQIPDLRAALAVGERVLVAGREIAVEIAPDGGVETLSERERQQIATGW
ncbi:MAG: VIT domain-containing protein [Gemmatimonadaceae bacterium]